MKFNLNMEFFENKRLLYILSGVACIIMSFVIFVISLVGMKNIGAFIFGAGKPADYGENPTNTIAAVTASKTLDSTPTPTVSSPTTEPKTETPVTSVPATATPDTVTSAPPTATPVPTDTVINVESITIPTPDGYSLINNAIEIKVGVSLTLRPKILPLDATNPSVQWSSTNPAVVTVDSYGVITARGIGSATIMAKWADNNDIFGALQVRVSANDIDVSNVTIAGSSTREITVGDIIDLTAMVNPTNATYQNLVWSSNKPNVAGVTSSGSNNKNAKVTAKAEGTVEITATAQNGKKAYVTITILPKNEPTETTVETPPPSSPSPLLSTKQPTG